METYVAGTWDRPVVAIWDHHEVAISGHQGTVAPLEDIILVGRLDVEGHDTLA